ncbi:flagellar filament capping protein FliD [Microbulbifer thermotolerans]|uniref:flagellar filament capping protein FliD n=1 Tax=Microbulbifer thermotolerans TaxID=252514 RepID=UPI0022494D59|nr:flagellar filament capping protein FliD [Microbulbifer thermotolerans]MCX2780131.1 flagellar filament capping protein FliD [Microbulbifer thermotolerans]MCX2805555.1 flagellar filament capping protein FliD [Microbulbifer thermotolerans]MCX2831917.1 flagellar filament capping protein FliD [Microbulbifer thermotolerans]
MATISSLGIGSGLDLNGLLDDLESAERQQLTPIVAQQQSYQAKISAFGQLESALDSLRQAALELSEADGFTDVKSSLSGEALSATVGDGAVVGSYEIEVTQRARNYSIATEGVADKEALLGAGTIQFTFASDSGPSGGAAEVEVTAEDSSLEGIRDAINAADIGVVASIINDGSDQPYRLVLSSAETGTEAAIASVAFSGDLQSSLNTDGTTEVEAQDAKLKVNGIDITSQSNRVEDAIQGITLDLEDTGSVSLEITRDTAAIEGKISGFVSAYNNLQDTISSLTSYDQETGSAGVLIGNVTVQSVESRLRNTLTDVLTSSGTFNSLSDLGITLEVDGTLTLDEEALGDLVAEQLSDLTHFFAGVADEDGLADRLDTVLGAMLDEDGTLDSATSGLESSIERLQERYEDTEARIDSTIERYRTQFTQLDLLITQMNTTSTYLTQQFEALSAQLGQSD